jgi:hypothetical protein
MNPWVLLFPDQMQVGNEIFEIPVMTNKTKITHLDKIM